MQSHKAYQVRKDYVEWTSGKCREDEAELAELPEFEGSEWNIENTMGMQRTDGI